MAGVQTAAGEQTFGIFFDVVGDKLVHPGGESDDLGSDVIDEHRPIDSRLIKILEKSLGRAAELGDFVEVGALPLHQFKGVRLEHFEGLNVDVAVCDQVSRRSFVPSGMPSNIEATAYLSVACRNASIHSVDQFLDRQKVE